MASRYGADTWFSTGARFQARLKLFLILVTGRGCLSKAFSLLEGAGASGFPGGGDCAALDERVGMSGAWRLCLPVGQACRLGVGFSNSTPFFVAICWSLPANGAINALCKTRRCARMPARTLVRVREEATLENGSGANPEPETQILLGRHLEPITHCRTSNGLTEQRHGGDDHPYQRSGRGSSPKAFGPVLGVR